MSIIETCDLTRIYTSYRKREGFLNQIKDFFARETISVRAVNEFDFEMNEGELIGVVGENGAGKTTLLKMLAGVLVPTAGTINVLGHVPHKRRHSFLSQIALISGGKQGIGWDLPATEYFRYQQTLFGVSKPAFRTNVEYLSTLLNIGSKLAIPIRKLSLGERMKTTLINGLLYSPKLVLLDEPTIGLDVFAQENIRGFLKQYVHDRKAGIIITSHNLSDIEETCDRVVAIQNGNKVFDGDLVSLKESFAPDMEIQIEFDRPPDFERIREYGEISGTDDRTVSLVILADHRAVFKRLITDFDGITQISVNEAPLSKFLERIMRNGGNG